MWLRGSGASSSTRNWVIETGFNQEGTVTFAGELDRRNRTMKGMSPRLTDAVIHDVTEGEIELRDAAGPWKGRNR